MTQTLNLNNETDVQTLSVTQVDSTQSFAVEQSDSTQEVKVNPDVEFLRGKDGVSPTVRIEAAEGGYSITFTDKEHSETVFVANGESVTDEQVQEAVNAYLEEHPINIETVDSVSEGDMRPVTSNAVYVEMSNINALLKTI